MTSLSSISNNSASSRLKWSGVERRSDANRIARLPECAEPLRGIPNEFLRSALFAAIQGKTRRYLDGQILSTSQGSYLRFTGNQLDQSDLDVWMQALHMMRSRPLGSVCYLRASAFLASIGRDNGKSQYEWLGESFRRLANCYVEIQYETTTFENPLLASCLREEGSGLYALSLDPSFVKLYRKNNWTKIEWRHRRRLLGKPLALWLHGFYSSQSEPVMMEVEHLRQFSGSSNKDEYDFKRKLKAAFADLKKAAGISAIFDGNKILVNPRPEYPKVVRLFPR